MENGNVPYPLSHVLLVLQFVNLLVAKEEVTRKAFSTSKSAIDKLRSAIGCFLLSNSGTLIQGLEIFQD